MATLTYTEVETMIKYALVANTSTDAPIAAAEYLEAINHSYQVVWEASGGRLSRKNHVDAWSSASLASGEFMLTGDLTDIADVEVMFYSTTQTSVGDQTTDKPLHQVKWGVLQHRRGSSAYGSASQVYGTPQIWAPAKLVALDTSSDINKLTVYVWPPASGTAYFPIHYRPQFVPMDGGSTDTFNLTDIETRDVGWYAAMLLAPRIGRAELLPQFALNLSESTQKSLERKLAAMLDAAQDDART